MAANITNACGGYRFGRRLEADAVEKHTVVESPYGMLFGEDAAADAHTGKVRDFSEFLEPERAEMAEYAFLEMFGKRTEAPGIPEAPELSAPPGRRRAGSAPEVVRIGTYQAPSALRVRSTTVDCDLEVRAARCPPTPPHPSNLCTHPPILQC